MYVRLITLSIKNNCVTVAPQTQLNPFASEAVYTRNFFSDRMSDSL